ncbi:MAG TPA: helix-turn-helix domain-containing protein [bacterium]|nr:helix-turn-helix domain-containing protein [bacterium]
MEDINPVETLEAYLRGELSLEEACSRLKIHRSTLWRKCRRLKKAGIEGLRHGLKGRRSNRAVPMSTREEILKFWIEKAQPASMSIYSFHRKLLRSEYKVSYSTLLRWLSGKEAQERASEGPQEPNKMAE